MISVNSINVLKFCRDISVQAKLLLTLLSSAILNPIILTMPTIRPQFQQVDTYASYHQFQHFYPHYLH